MKTFNIQKPFNIEARLKQNGFTFYDGEEPMWAAKIQKGEYITVANDLETVSIYELPDDMKEKDFIKYLVGNEGEYNEHLANYCTGESSGDTRCNLLYALGIT